MPDVAWNETEGRYTYINWPAPLGQKTSVSEWMSVNNVPIDFQISAAFKEGQLPGAKSTVVVVMGLEFATAMQNDSPYVVKGIGTCGIVACLLRKVYCCMTERCGYSFGHAILYSIIS